MKRQAGPAFTILASLLVFAATSCSKPKPVEQTKRVEQKDSSPNQLSVATNETSDVCTLLTKEDIEAVQGEAFKDTKASEKSSAGLSVAQCYFELPNASNSVVLNITRKAEGGRDPVESWKEIFHSERHEKDEEGEERKPQEVGGLGDEAFWTGTRVGGALFVLKGNFYLRISVGGAGDQAQKLEKSKRLAESALKRL
jgi:hypothetical protein